MRPTHLFLFVVLSAVALKSTQALRRPLKYEVFDNTSGTPDTRFKSQIGSEYALQALVAATEFALNTFDQSEEGGRDYASVLLVVVSFNAIGRPFGIATNNESRIDVNADYLQIFPGDVKDEFTGVLYFMSGLVWEWTGNGKAPTGLITGMADYVRLVSGWTYPGWPQRGSGLRWDDGYAVTANFLEYCVLLLPEFVAVLNSMMIDGYNDMHIAFLVGKFPDELWEDYKLFYGTPGQALAGNFEH